jgi:hypothetical protein
MGFIYTINYIQAKQVATSILNIHLDENPKFVWMNVSSKINYKDASIVF